MNKLNHYLSMLCFTAGLLFGVQLPNCLHQYVQRVDAHFQEASLAIAPYQQLADELYNGSMQSLVEEHKTSKVVLFQREAEPILQLYTRWQYLGHLRQQLNNNLMQQLIVVVQQGDSAILDETLSDYQATIPLTPVAIICALIGGVLASILFELISSLLFAPFRQKNRTQAS